MSYSVYTTPELASLHAWSIGPTDLPKVFLGITAGSFVLAGLDSSFLPISEGLGILTVVAWYKNNI